MLAIFRGSINSQYMISGNYERTSCTNCKDDMQVAVRFCEECDQFVCRKCILLHKCGFASVGQAFMDKPSMKACPTDAEMTKSEQLGKFTVNKYNNPSVKLDDDKKDCWVTGMAVTHDGRLIVTDFENKKVKTFNTAMCFLTSLTLSFHPWAVALVDANEAVVSMSSKQLAFVDISDVSKMSIKNILKFGFDIYGVQPYRDKFIVTSMTSGRLKIPSVKMLGKSGQVYWTVALSLKGKQLFTWPLYLTILHQDVEARVIVTDSGNSTLTALDAKTGAFVKRTWLDMATEPQCITTDSQNIFMTCIGTNDVVVMSKDLTESRILLSKRGAMGLFIKRATSEYSLVGKIWALEYDNTSKQLFISYENRNNLDIYTITKTILKPAKTNTETGQVKWRSASL